MLNLNDNNTDNSYNFAVINLSNINDPVEPIHSYNSKNVKYWGLDNLMPYHLIDYYRTSVSHGSIVKTKVEMTLGEGVEESEDILTNEFRNKVNHSLGINDLIEKLAFDLHLTGSFAIKVYYTPEGDLIDFCHQPIQHVRKSNKDNYFVIKDWLNDQEGEVYIREYKPLFGAEDRTQLYFYCNYSAGMVNYSLPDYYPGLTYIRCQAELANFHINNVLNSFLPSSVLKFPQQISPEEQKKMVKEINKKFQGTQNAGKLFIIFQDGEKTVEFIPIVNNGNVDFFNNFNEIIKSNIYSAHRLSSPVIAGEAGSGSLGGNGNELQKAINLFYNKSIKRPQMKIEECINTLLASTNFPEPIKIVNNLPPDFITLDPEVAAVMTKDEIRELYGLKNLNDINELPINNQ